MGRGKEHKNTINMIKSTYVNRIGKPCVAKKRYGTKQDASLVIKRLLSLPKDSTGRPEAMKLYKYECKHCGGWHLTSQNRAKKTKQGSNK